MAQLKRLNDLPRSQANKIRARQKAGAMNEYFDKEGYLCYSVAEHENYKKGKAGRKPVQYFKLAGNINEVVKEIENTLKICKEKGFTTIAELIEYDECLKNKEN